MSQPMSRRGRTLVFNDGDRENEWAAADPDPSGPKDFQASSYRALCLSAGGIAKLKAIRAGLAKEQRAADSKVPAKMATLAEKSAPTFIGGAWMAGQTKKGSEET